MKLLKNCKTIKGLKFEYGGEFNFIYNSSTTNHSAYRPEFTCETEHKNKRHVIYAHCVDGEIVYIGETSNTFIRECTTIVTIKALQMYALEIITKTIH